MKANKYYPPKYKDRRFNCPLCGVFAQQLWHRLVVVRTDGPRQLGSLPTDFDTSICEHCGLSTYWYEYRMIIPSEAPVPQHHPDTPEACVEIYDEARDIVSRSPKAAAALLRLCLQTLMPELGEKGKNINDDIKSLVSKGLPVQIQQALDFCRVVGNNGVHPGEIDLGDSPEIAHTMFDMINFIIEDRISKPKQVADLYNALPEGAREAIEKRDGK